MASIFADIKTPYVNESTLKRIMSDAVKENIFQRIITKPGEAVTEKFSTDTDAAQIQVIRVKPDTTPAREIGADTNGGWFNSASAVYPTTEAYGINILQSIDNVIDIPTNQQEMINVDTAAAELTNLVGKVDRNVNAVTFAAQLAKNFNTFDNAATGKNWITLGATPNYLDAIIDANSKLDDGNEAQGIDTYPYEGRAIFVRSAAKAALLKSGQIIVGGSNYAQDIIRRGGMDADTRPNTTEGYLGEISNCPVYFASQAIWTLAEKYLGLTAGALAGVHMLVVSGIGTGRALAFNNAIKTVPSPLGQGIRLQPKYRFGAECWDELSVVPVVASDFTGPRATSSAAKLVVRAPGSRT